MITILVAEDQTLIQKDICRKIEKTEKNVKIIGTAINGEEAYQKILTLHPDILITDIRMPLQSGLELIRRLRSENIPISTVILSGYRDFEYAKEAMKLNVDEYLLKPVSIEDLVFVLDSLEEKLTARKDSRLKEALRSMLHTRSPQILPDIFSQLNYPTYFLVLMNLDSCCRFSIMDFLPFESELNQILNSGLFSKYLSREEQHFVFDGDTYNEKLFLFCLRTTTEKKLIYLLQELRSEIEKITQSVTFCVGAPLTTLSVMGMESRILRMHTEEQLVFEKSSILHARDLLSAKEVQPGHPLDQKQLEQFRFCIQTQNLTELLKELHNFLDQCKTRNTTQKELAQHINKILAYCFPELSRKSMTNLKLEIDEYISNAKTYKELDSSLSFLFRQNYKKVYQDSHSFTEPEKLVDDIKKYMDANFSREININDIAVHFSITPAYLSRIFKKYADVKPIDYLTNCRIQHACHYFTHSQLSVKDVAQLCGYSNQYYFSKAFKQETQLSPTEYRIQNQETTSAFS